MLDKRPIAKARLLLELAHKILAEERNDFEASGHQETDLGFAQGRKLSDAVEYNQTTLEELDGLL